jgi:hypothetical protein
MSLPATTTYLIKNIRWNIHSFINDSEIWKSKFGEVVQYMFWKLKFSREVVIRFKLGARLVAQDENGPCTNCYHYGDQEESGSKYWLCMNHRNEDITVWIDFEEFSKISRAGQVYHTYEEYEIKRRIVYLKVKAEMEEYLRQLSF